MKTAMEEFIDLYSCFGVKHGRITAFGCLLTILRVEGGELHKIAVDKTEVKKLETILETLDAMAVVGQAIYEQECRETN